MAAPHMNRAGTVKLLEALKANKIKRVADLRQTEITNALTEVVAKVRLRQRYWMGWVRRGAAARGGAGGSYLRRYCLHAHIHVG